MLSAIVASITNDIKFISFFKKKNNHYKRCWNAWMEKLRHSFHVFNDQYINNSDIEFFFYKEITLDDSYL